MFEVEKKLLTGVLSYLSHFKMCYLEKESGGGQLHCSIASAVLQSLCFGWLGEILHVGRDAF